MSTRVEQFQKLAEAQPDNELFRFSLAQALLAENRGAEARPHYEFCIAQKADWMMPRIIWGKWLLKNEGATSARPLLERALELAVEQHHEDPERELRAILGELA